MRPGDPSKLETAEICRLRAGFRVLRRQLAGHLFHRERICGGPRLPQQRPSRPSLPGLPKLHILNRSAHSPEDLPPSSGDLFPGVAPLPISRSLVLPPPCPSPPRTAPSTCGEDAEGDENLADHVTPVLGTELDATREEFSGSDQVLRGTGSSSSDRVGYGRSGDARRDESRQLRCLAAQGEVEVARRVSCVP